MGRSIVHIDWGEGTDRDALQEMVWGAMEKLFLDLIESDKVESPRLGGTMFLPDGEDES